MSQQSALALQRLCTNAAAKLCCPSNLTRGKQYDYRCTTCAKAHLYFRISTQASDDAKLICAVIIQAQLRQNGTSHRPHICHPMLQGRSLKRQLLKGGCLKCAMGGVFLSTTFARRRLTERTALTRRFGAGRLTRDGQKTLLKASWLRLSSASSEEATAAASRARARKAAGSHTRLSAAALLGRGRRRAREFQGQQSPWRPSSRRRASWRPLRPRTAADGR